MLTRLTDLDAAKWILEGRESQTSPPYTPGRVRNCLPSVFPGYAKLFHPIWTDKRVTDWTISWHEAESGRISSVGVSLGGTLRSQTPDEAYIGDRLLWRELAQRYGLVFHAEVSDASFTQNFPGKSWPRYLFGPDEGRLDTATCDALISILNGFSDFDASPEFWWPADRSWCINTDYAARTCSSSVSSMCPRLTTIVRTNRNAALVLGSLDEASRPASICAWVSLTMRPPSERADRQYSQPFASATATDISSRVCELRAPLESELLKFR